MYFLEAGQNDNYTTAGSVAGYPDTMSAFSAATEHLKAKPADSILIVQVVAIVALDDKGKAYLQFPTTKEAPNVS